MNKDDQLIGWINSNNIILDKESEYKIPITYIEGVFGHSLKESEMDIDSSIFEIEEILFDISWSIINTPLPKIYTIKQIDLTKQCFKLQFESISSIIDGNNNCDGKKEIFSFFSCGLKHLAIRVYIDTNKYLKYQWNRASIIQDIWTSPAGIGAPDLGRIDDIEMMRDDLFIATGLPPTFTPTFLPTTSNMTVDINRFNTLIRNFQNNLIDQMQTHIHQAALSSTSVTSNK